ncbi:transcriptional regulator [Bradyrhizobium japonicum]|uniref:Transcriptional regulator n=1 Tax=Bradyrhizobium japonicum TaxID=375 RepID=A0A0A3XFP2_BRAJP|nr:LysR family transcriptional regulator [Bradyrhizobium japonicum]KGT73110.1 transcriptional regulator [Bradyrhizobium japonicum]
MDLRQLRYFLGVVEHGSIARAADELHVAQSALSVHLNRLEKELGCILVHRTSRGIVPTESGMRLANRARSILTEIGTIADEVRGIEAVPVGNVAVGMPTSLGIALTVPLAMTVRQKYPLVRLRIAEGLSGHMSQWLLSGQPDVALVFGSDIISGVAKELLAKEYLNLVGANDAEAVSSAGEISPTSVFDLPLILPGRPHGLREEVERAASQHGRRLNVMMEIDSLENIKVLVAAGAGYTVLSARVAGHGSVSARLKYRPIGKPRIEREIYIAHPSNTPLSVAASSIRTVLLTLLRDASLEDDRS